MMVRCNEKRKSIWQHQLGKNKNNFFDDTSPNKTTSFSRNSPQKPLQKNPGQNAKHTFVLNLGVFSTGDHSHPMGWDETLQMDSWIRWYFPSLVKILKSSNKFWSKIIEKNICMQRNGISMIHYSLLVSFVFLRFFSQSYQICLDVRTKSPPD